MPSILFVGRSPVRVIHYSCCELVLTLLEWAGALAQYRRSLACFLVLVLSLVALHNTPSQYQVDFLSDNTPDSSFSAVISRSPSTAGRVI